MIRPLRALVTIAAASAAAIGISAPVHAHDGEWGIFLDTPQSWPGGTVHLRGDLPTTGPVDLVLVGPTTTPLVTIDDAPNGHFETTVTFPPDAALGGWTVEARAPGMTSMQVPVVLLAPPPPGQDDEEAEPYPTGVPRASIGPGFGSVPPAVALTVPSPAGETDLVPVASAGLALAALLILIARTRRIDPSR